MYKLILLSIVQSALLVFGQMFLKFTMNKIDKLSFTWRCIKQRRRESVTVLEEKTAVM